jgi:hypothetical protein
VPFDNAFDHKLLGPFPRWRSSQTRIQSSGDNSAAPAAEMVKSSRGQLPITQAGLVYPLAGGVDFLKMVDN